jgi:HD-GYP domain-containing protein (c-di-GMP phosphodiesterase class II)
MSATRPSNELTRLSPRPWHGVFDRAAPRANSGGEIQRALPFVAIVCLVAGVAAGVVAKQTLGGVTPSHLYAAIMLTALGVAAEMLSHGLVKGAATGSISSIPFAAAGLCSPTWATVAAIGAGAALVQVLSRRQWIKGVFNVAQMVLGLSLAILVYRVSGGAALIDQGRLSFFVALWKGIWSGCLLVATVVLVNTATVSGVVAIVQQRSVVDIWKATTLPTAPFILLTAFLTFYLAWLYSSLGAAGAVGLAIPLLGVRQLFRTTVELTKVTEELLDLMVAAIEARDPYTSGHSQRVSHASKIIARAIGLRPAEIERVGVAALLHDVGKIDEAFAPILAKEGRLTPEEWDIMKRHPIRSAELVGLLSSLKDVVPSVRNHHENWDGTGYPDGLKGTAIPQASRIIMFADTLDAMTTDRPYRKALSMDEAKAEIIKFRGRQFDPEICDRIVQPEVWAELYQSYADGVLLKNAHLAAKAS